MQPISLAPDKLHIYERWLEWALNSLSMLLYFSQSDLFCDSGGGGGGGGGGGIDCRYFFERRPCSQPFHD